MSRPTIPVILALAILVGASMADIFKVGFYADDFIFLDAARRMPVDQVLLGQHGIWPWYRPLSRELMFYLFLASEPYGPLLAHCITLILVFVSSLIILQLGRRLTGEGGGVLATCLFATYNLTKFLAGGASGIQDLLGVCLTLCAVMAHIRGHNRLALLLTGLAPFAKETAFVTGPIILGYSFIHRRGRLSWPLVCNYGLVGLGTAAIHLLVRTTWHGHGGTLPSENSIAGLGQALARAFLWVFTWNTPSTVISGILGCLAAVSASVLLVISNRLQLPGRQPPARSGVYFLILAAILSLMPLVVGNLLVVVVPRAYYAFPAIPWLVLIIDRAFVRLPMRARMAILPILVGANVWGLGYRAPDLNNIRNWKVEEMSWKISVQVAAIAERFGSDLRRELPGRTPGLVVLYSRIPFGTFFHGAATREALRDPTIRAYYLRESPQDIPSASMAIVMFDPTNCHLRVLPRERGIVRNQTVRRIVSNEPDVALTMLRYWGAGADRDFELGYLQAAASLMRKGSDDYWQSLRQAGLDDSSGTQPRELAIKLAPGEDEALVHGYERMLRSPRAAETHRLLADSLLIRGHTGPAGVELRISIGLCLDSSTERYLMALVLMHYGARDLAIAELKRSIELGSPALAVLRAKETYEELVRQNPPEPRL